MLNHPLHAIRALILPPLIYLLLASSHPSWSPGVVNQGLHNTSRFKQLFENNHAWISASRPKSSSPLESADACKNRKEPHYNLKKSKGDQGHLRTQRMIIPKKHPKCHMIAVWLTLILCFFLMFFFAISLFWSLWADKNQKHPATFMVAWVRSDSKAELAESWRRSNQLPLSCAWPDSGSGVMMCRGRSTSTYCYHADLTTSKVRILDPEWPSKLKNHNQPGANSGILVRAR